MDQTAANLSGSRRSRVKALAAQATSPADLANYTIKSTHRMHSTTKPGITCLDLHPNHRYTLSGGVDGTAIVFDREVGKNAESLKHHKKRINDVTFHTDPSGTMLFTASADHTCAVWDGAVGHRKVVAQFDDHSAGVVGCGVHPSGDYVITASADATWNMYDIESTKNLCSIGNADSKSESAYTTLSIHPDGLIMAATTDDNLVKVWDIKQQSNVKTFEDGHSGGISASAFSENGYIFATGDRDGNVKIWDLRRLACVQTFELGGACTSLAFSPSGVYMAVGSTALAVYQAKKWNVVKEYDATKVAITGVCFTPRSESIITTGMDRKMLLYSA
jgi:pre-mRNA-processing factor 19